MSVYYKGKQFYTVNYSTVETFDFKGVTTMTIINLGANPETTLFDFSSADTWDIGSLETTLNNVFNRVEAGYGGWSHCTIKLHPDVRAKVGPLIELTLRSKGYNLKS
jgi:hypothetical protein